MKQVDLLQPFIIQVQETNNIYLNVSGFFWTSDICDVMSSYGYVNKWTVKCKVLKVCRQQEDGTVPSPVHESAVGLSHPLHLHTYTHNYGEEKKNPHQPRSLNTHRNKEGGAKCKH